MIPLPSRLLVALIAMTLATGLHSAVTLVVDVQTTPLPQVTLSWNSQGSNTVELVRRPLGQLGVETWTVLTSNASSPYVDSMVVNGESYEYSMRSLSASRTNNRLAHVVATINAPLIDERGAVLLVVENTWTGELIEELKLLELNLVADGWVVERIDWNREGANNGADLRAAIKAAVLGNPNINSLFIFGAVEMVKSGWLGPDGHAYHPHETDLFYGDIDGLWTDGYSGSNYTPGDDTYDQSKYPSEIELRTGRVTFHSMSSFKKNEVEYLRDYIHKEHAYRNRHRDVTYQAYVGDEFYLSATNASIKPIVGAGNWVDGGTLDTLIHDESYLFGFGARTGSWNAARDGFQKAIFTACFRSHIQEFWSGDNNMRGMLTQPDWGLNAVWGARPAWYFHKLAAGLSIGQAVIETQNDLLSPYSYSIDGQYEPARDYEFYSDSIDLPYVSNNMMGDPTVRIAHIEPVNNLAVSRTDPANVQLTWSASPDTALIGYHVYSSNDRLGAYTRLTASPITDLFFDTPAADNIETWFQVRAIGEVTVPTGVYVEQSHGRFALAYDDGSVNTAPNTSSFEVVGKINTPLYFEFPGSDVDGDTLTPVVIDNPDNGQIRWWEGVPYYVSKRDTPTVDTATFVMFDGVTVSEPANITFTTGQMGETLLGWDYPDGTSAAQEPTFSNPHISSTAISGGPGTNIISAWPGTDAYTSRYIGSSLSETTDYFQWTVTPDSGYRMSLSRINLGICGGSGNSISYELRASTDGFNTYEVVPMMMGNVLGRGLGGNAGTLDTAECSEVAVLQNQNQAVDFRIHWWHAAGSSDVVGLGKITDPVYYDAIEDVSIFGTITTDAGLPTVLASETNFDVSEEGDYSIEVTLSAPPSAPVTITINRISGDSDLSVSVPVVPTFDFDATNWSTPQTLTIAAAYDNDVSSDSAVFEIVGDGVAGISLNVNEYDSAQPPVGIPDSYVVAVGSPLTVVAPGVLSNDTDANDEALTATLLSDVNQGTLELNADGSFTYTPFGSFEGSDSFTYIAEDGILQSEETTVTLSILTTAIKVNVHGVVNAYSPALYVAAQWTNSDTNILDSRWLEITGNGWYALDLGNVEITADTVLAFDFYSATEAEIQGIGMDTNNTDINPEYTFQIWGTQDWADQNFDNYGSSSPSIKHYEIAIGQYYTGTFRYLFVPQDDDANENAVSTYGNIHIYNPDTATDWAYTQGLDPLNKFGMSDDANSDGKPNYFHFGLATNPLSGSIGQHDRRSMQVEEEASEDYVTITAPFRLGATFSGTPLSSAPVDGITYTIYGDSDLAAPLGDLAIDEVTPAISTGLPALDDLDNTPGADWEYRTFRVTTPLNAAQPSFLWIDVNEAP